MILVINALGGGRTHYACANKSNFKTTVPAAGWHTPGLKSGQMTIK